MNLPTRIVFPIAKQRPKTLWLRKGFEELHIPIIDSPKWIKKLKPSENPRGPYVYPIEIFYENKSVLILYDIGTTPRQFYPGLMAKGRMYFKIHLHKSDRKKYPYVHVAPNSASCLEYLDYLDAARDIKRDRKYLTDFYFSGWHDDDGTRIKAVRIAKKQRGWRVIAGLQPFKHHTSVPPDLFISRLRFQDHLFTACKSKLCLALPGGRALPYMSFRHVELMGMGCCVLTVEPDAVLPGMIEQCQIHFKKDFSDFVEVCNEMIHDDIYRERIAAMGMKYYEDYLKPESNALYILNVIERRIFQ